MCVSSWMRSSVQGTERVATYNRPIGRRLQTLGELVARLISQRQRQARRQAIQPVSNRATPSAETPGRYADGHHLAHRLHLRREAIVRSGNFSKVNRGICHDIVDRRLERGGVVHRYVVLQLIERVATASFAAILDRKPVALSRAEERDTRGFISMTSRRPSSGLRRLHVGAPVRHDLAQHAMEACACVGILVGERQSGAT